MTCKLALAVSVLPALMIMPAMANITVAAGETQTVTTTTTGLSNQTADSGGVYHNEGTLTVSNSEFEDNHAQVYGGAIFNTGTLTIADGTSSAHTKFEDNTAHAGGAITSWGTGSVVNIGNYTEFSDNSTESTGGDAGGAMYLSDATLNAGNNVKFKDNSALSMMNENTQAKGAAGAVFAYNSDVNFGDNVEFDSNKSQYAAGALYVWNNTGANKSQIGKNARFVNNKSLSAYAGAIGNFDGTMTIDQGAVFENNSAKTKGGAIANMNFSGSGVAMTLTDATFKNNTAGTQGGAIYNDGSLTLLGDNVFADNKSGDGLNDIYNTGTVNISGNLTLDGGIAGTGDITFDKDSTLNMTLGKTTIQGGTITTNGANLNMLIANGSDGKTYDFVDAASLDQVFTIGENTLYDISMNADDGKITITKKSNSDVTAALNKAGISGSTAAAVVAVSGVAATGNERADAAFAALADAAQSGDVATAEKISDGINPDVTPSTQAISSVVQNQVLTLASNRMAGIAGRSGGDVEMTGGGIWAQGLFNKSKLNGSFHGYTRGIAAGLDTVLNRQFTIGAGYAYSDTDVHIDGGRKNDISNNTVFLYGQYKPSQWYFDAIAQYTFGEYKEKVDFLGKSSKHDVDSFGGSLTAGYNTMCGLTPTAGMRYLHVNQDDYTDSFGIRISSKDTDYLTGVAGVKYAFDFQNYSAVKLSPELYALATYDFLSDKGESTVTMPAGAASYVVHGDRLSRMGGEFGVGLSAQYKEFEISVNYDLAIHEDYTSHTGMLKLRMEF